MLSIPPDTPFVARLEIQQPGLQQLPAQITGRAGAGDEQGSVIHEWPALRAEARFEGTAVTIRFNDDVGRWRITVDKAWVDIARPGRQDLRIEGLPAGLHKIRAEKISETYASAQFGGFLLDENAAPLSPPDPPPRLIEFIGDSDTVGFGNTSEQRECTEEEIFATTDTSLSYPARLADALGADYRVVARSGIGLLRNHSGAMPDQTMQHDYPLAVPSDPAAETLPAPMADLLIIAIGANDFGSDMTEGEPWADHEALSVDFGPALTQFARARLQENPGAHLILVAFDEYGGNLTRPYRDTAEALQAEGFPTELVFVSDLARNACLWHPSLADHAKMASMLEDTIRRKVPGWDG